METRQLRRNSVGAKSDWVKCQSRTCPAKSYLFNKATGETKWCSDSETPSKVKPPSPIKAISRGTSPLRTSPKGTCPLRTSPRRISPRRTSPGRSEDIKRLPPKWTITKPSRTPAQDRLKRLQTTLRKDSKVKPVPKENNNDQKKIFEDKKIKLEKPEQKQPIEHKVAETPPNDGPPKENNKPSTSAFAVAIKVENSCSSIQTSAKAKPPTPKKSRKPILKKSSYHRMRTLPCPSQAESTSIDRPKETKEASPQTDTIQEEEVYPCTTAAINLGSGIVNKIKEICKSTMSSYKNAKKAIEERARGPTVTKTPFKTPKKDNSALTNPLAIEEALKELQRERNAAEAATVSPLSIVVKRSAATNTIPTAMNLKAIAGNVSSSQLCNTPKTLVIPAYERGTANSRLENLRLSLMQQPSYSVVQKTSTKALCASACSSALACVLQDSTPCSQQQHVDDGMEAMDWSPIEDQTVTIEISSTSNSGFVAAGDKNQEETVSEYYAAVNENLLRFAAEQKTDAEWPLSMWLADYYYFVLDTNVMLRHLTFLDDLSHMKLCDTKGTILYIPYCVLQELDKLKQRAQSESTKLLAARAIKFLNTHFESKNRHIQAQSAISELNHLIEVVSPDDRILNCCLQLKEHIKFLILLTEDINLRNKAICNNILVSTKSDLVSRHAAK